MRFTDLVNIDELRELCESFTVITGAVTAILDLDGNILVATGWQDICTRFHRVNEATAHRCLESDTVLAGNLKKGGLYNVYKCKNGLVDVAVPIAIRNEHVANFFTGQFFLEVPDREYFIRQAEEFGLDKEPYLEALGRVPVFPEDKIKAMMEFFTRLAQLIGEMGLAKKELAEANRELQQSESELKVAQEIARVGRWEMDLLGNNLKWSDTIFDLFEIDKANFPATYDAFIETVHTDDRDMVTKAYQDSIANKQPYNIEHRLLMKDGRVKWVNELCRTEYDAQGNGIRSVGIVQEITERRMAEKDLQDSEEKYRNLVDNALVGIFQSTLSGDFLHVNQAMYTLLGYETWEEFSRIKAWEIYRHKEGRENFVRELQLKGKVADLEVEFKTKGGTSLWVLINATLKDEILSGMFSNITALKLAERALLESERKLQEAQKMARLGSWKWEIGTGKVEWSEEVYRIFRLDPKEFTPQLDSIMALSPWPGDNERDKDILQRAIDNREQGSYEQRFLRPDGSAGYYASTFRGEFDDNGNLISMLGTVQDITEQKRSEEFRLNLERQLFHTHKMESLGILAGGIAHDFNNILTAIVGYTELTIMKLPPESPVIGNLHKIEKSAARATDLAKKMLAYSGKGHFALENIDLNSLLNEMTNLLEVPVSGKATIHLNLASPIPAIYADSAQIRQIIINLVINASEAIGESSGVITISTGTMKCDRGYLEKIWPEDSIAAGEYVCLEVADNGCGMDKETMSKIFDPFFSTKFTGRGLGMAALHGIVRGHKGAILVQSEVGKGSAVKVLLPVSTVPAA